MNTSKFVALTLSLMLAGIGAANAFELKGYSLGQEIAECPDGVKKGSEPGFDFTCTFTPQESTIAGKRIGHIYLLISDGKLIAATVDVGRGQNKYSHSELYEAVKAKYGYPNGNSKEHIGEYLWVKGDQTLKVDSWRGTVIILDRTPFREAQLRLAGKNKNDL